MTKLTDEDVATLKKAYDSNKDGVLSEEEIHKLISDYSKGLPVDDEVKKVLIKYDENNDGKIDHQELSKLKQEISLLESNARYAGYTSSFARAFRYLAFTSDFGEALR